MIARCDRDVPQGAVSSAQVPRQIPERERWEAYEAEKRRLQEAGLSPAEYERRLRELLDRLEL